MAKAVEEKMEIQVYRFTGISPLLMANINSVNLNLPKIKLGTKPNSGDVKKIAEGNLYKNDDGSYYMPCEALRLSLFKGCSGQKMAGDRRGLRRSSRSEAWLGCVSGSARRAAWR